MASFRDTTEESKLAWERNADFWDQSMGDESNYFHRNIVRPRTEELLNIEKGDHVLDIACGNGNFSERLVEMGATVVAFDYSENMIKHAKKRRQRVLDSVQFIQCDATDYNQLISLKKERLFDKAVANMAIMDISDIDPLLRAVNELLCAGGSFVFSTHQPCFERPEGQYLTPWVHKGAAIEGQPFLQNYYHRSLQDLFQACFNAGFAMDGLFEESMDQSEFPVIMIVRLRKWNP
ncbi:class I SAM-dependent methyltransferase [Bacillus sp. 1P06AnD]|uniref:class I SAM-dependent methyltransferase n=1 Tax=Bacillus sp. 1P06AnD TaxID=3132208 RepID=UPI0039A01445